MFWLFVRLEHEKVLHSFFVLSFVLVWAITVSTERKVAVVTENSEARWQFILPKPLVQTVDFLAFFVCVTTAVDMVYC